MTTFVLLRFLGIAALFPALDLWIEATEYVQRNAYADYRIVELDVSGQAASRHDALGREWAYAKLVEKTLCEAGETRVLVLGAAGMTRHVLQSADLAPAPAHRRVLPAGALTARRGRLAVCETISRGRTTSCSGRGRSGRCGPFSPTARRGPVGIEEGRGWHAAGERPARAAARGAAQRLRRAAGAGSGCASPGTERSTSPRRPSRERPARCAGARLPGIPARHARIADTSGWGTPFPPLDKARPPRHSEGHGDRAASGLLRRVEQTSSQAAPGPLPAPLAVPRGGGVAPMPGASRSPTTQSYCCR